MDQGLVPKRYAKALYEVALENGTQAKLYELMQHLAASFGQEPALAATMANPFVSDADKAALILTASRSDASDPEMARFIGLLKANGRLGMVRDIAAAYLRIYRKANRISVVKVTAASPMGEQEQQRLKSLILSHLDGGRMEYSFDVDPDLIGGFAITIDNERLDASVKNELKQLRLKLLSNK